MSTHSHTYLFQSNILYVKKVSVSFGGWAAFSNSWTCLNCTEDIKIVLLRRELGGYTQQWVLTHLHLRNRWGVNAKAC